MDKERREGAAPVPGDLHGRLTIDQRLELRKWENFGWCIAFVRRPLFQDITVVLKSGDGSQLGVLEPDGELNMEPAIAVR